MKLGFLICSHLGAICRYATRIQMDVAKFGGIWQNLLPNPDPPEVRVRISDNIVKFRFIELHQTTTFSASVEGGSTVTPH
jgi:hypothetical protein